MHQQKRSKNEILFDILAALHKSPMKITRIMYATNSSCTIISRMLRIMKNARYVAVPETAPRHPLSLRKEGNESKLTISRHYDQVYALTEEGNRFYSRIAPAMEELKILLNVVDAQNYAEEALRYSNELDLRLAMQ